MLLKIRLSLSTITLLMLSCTSSQQHSTPIKEEQASKIQVIKNVQILTMSDSLLQKNSSIVIKGDIIHWIGPTEELADYPGADILDAENKFIMPGLADMHVHIRSELELLSYLYYGVTTLLQLSGPNADIDLFALKEDLKSGKAVGPNLYMTGPMLDGDPAIWSEPVSLPVADADKAEKAVVDQSNRGYDFIKIYNRLSTPALDAVFKTAQKEGMTVIGHIPREPGALYAIQNGERMIAHMEEFFFSYFDCVKCGENKFPDEGKIPELIQAVKANKVWVTPNLSFVAATRFQLDDLEQVISDDEFKFLSSQNKRSWMRYNPTTRKDLESFDKREKVKYKLCQKLTLQFHQAGIPLLAGTDASTSGMYPGKSMHLELNELSKTGMSNFEVLKTATKNPGTFINEYAKNPGKRFGEIKIGNQADLLVLDLNPLENIDFEKHIYKVILKGEIMDRAEINRMRLALLEE